MAETIHLQGGPAHGRIVMVDIQPGVAYRVPMSVNYWKTGETEAMPPTLAVVEYRPIRGTDGQPWLDQHGRQYYEP